MISYNSRPTYFWKSHQVITSLPSQRKNAGMLFIFRNLYKSSSVLRLKSFLILGELLGTSAFIFLSISRSPFLFTNID